MIVIIAASGAGLLGSGSPYQGLRVSQSTFATDRRATPGVLSPMTDSRLTELEIKFSHQEAALEDVQKALYEQHKVIEAMRTQLVKLTQQMAGMADQNIGPADEKPPHY